MQNKHNTQNRSLDGIAFPPVLKLSWNAMPALFGKAEHHNGTSEDARGGTPG